jgi:hypothetical protein
MSNQTIKEYLEEERQKAAENQLRIEEEAARIELLRYRHHRTGKQPQPQLELLPAVKAATKVKPATKRKTKRTTVTVIHAKPRATKKAAAKVRKRA